MFCYKCWRKSEHCLCEQLHSFRPRTTLVILIHPMEAKKEKVGTGRLTRALVEGCHFIMGVDFTNDPEVNALLADESNECFCLYPGDSALNLTTTAPTFAQHKKQVIFVIDATWPCAKKMMRLSANLQKLPRLAFSGTPVSRFVIKEQPKDFCLSTIESVYYLYDALAKQGAEPELLASRAHEGLIHTLDHLVKFQQECALDPNKKSYRSHKSGYSKVEDRKKSKKWDKINLF